MDNKAAAEVWYLFNSGFAVKVGRRLLIFDYCNDTPYKRLRGLDGGVIRPEEIRDLDVTVFVSHAHPDHFIPDIFKWSAQLPRIRYVLSGDVAPVGDTENITRMPERAFCEVGGLLVRTLKSTDEGVAFIVEVDGLRMYHAGDLNWWHWEGEPEDENTAMAADYKGEIDRLAGEAFHIAFVPADPRLGAQYVWGLDYFMGATDTKKVFPMHFLNKYSIFGRLEKDPATKEYRDRIVRISRRGEKFVV